MSCDDTYLNFPTRTYQINGIDERDYCNNFYKDIYILHLSPFLQS